MRPDSPAIPSRLFAPSVAPRAALILAACAGSATPSAAQVLNWTGATSSLWSMSSNWLQNVLPSNSSDVRIGTLPGVQNATTHVNFNASIARLVVTNGMTVDTDSMQLNVANDTFIAGANLTPGNVLYRSKLRVQSAEIGFVTNDITVTDQAEIELWPVSSMRVNGVAHLGPSSAIRGSGNIFLHGAGTTFINDGSLQPSTGYGLRMQQLAGGLYDLDGAIEQGSVFLSGYNMISQQGQSLYLSGTGIADAFSSYVSMTSDAVLQMDLSNGWRADAASEFWVHGLDGLSGQTIQIRGSGQFRFDGLMRLTGGEFTDLRVLSETFRIEENARVRLGEDTRAEFGRMDNSSQVIVEGGEHEVHAGASLLFRGPTRVQGGSFIMDDATGAGGRVELHGATEWAGTSTFDGLLRQNGAATVVSSSVINVDRFDMDGALGSTVWNVNNLLSVNAGNLQSDGSDSFSGTINIAGGFLPRLTVNVADGAWTSSAAINLTGDNNFYTTRLAGSSLLFSGDLTLPSGRAQITSDVALLGSSNVQLIGDTAALRMAGMTTVMAGASFSGAGRMLVSQTGQLTLRNGANLGTVGLVNGGVLRLGEDAIPAISVAGALVHSFESDAVSRWNITIGGRVAGSEHDVLLVGTGGAQVGGAISVDLVDLGAGFFQPVIGDRFVVLSSLAPVTGAFASNPTTNVGSLTYHWLVEHNPHSVVLVLDSIVPAPGPGAMMVLAAQLVGFGRKRPQPRR